MGLGDVGCKKRGLSISTCSVDIGDSSQETKRVSRLRSFGRSTLNLRARTGSSGSLGKAKGAVAAAWLSRTSLSAGTDQGRASSEMLSERVQSKVAKLLGLPDCPATGTKVAPHTASFFRRASVLGLTPSLAPSVTATSLKSAPSTGEGRPTKDTSTWYKNALTSSQFDWQLGYHLATDPSAATTAYPTSLQASSFHQSARDDSVDGYDPLVYAAWDTLPTSAHAIASSLRYQTHAFDFGADPDLALHLAAAPSLTYAATELSLAEFLDFPPAIATSAYVLDYKAFSNALRTHAAEESLLYAVEALAWRGASRRVAPRQATGARACFA